LIEIFRDFAGRYGEHDGKFSLQPNQHKKCYCVLPNNCTHQTFLKKSCSLRQRWALDWTWIGLDPDYDKMCWIWVGSGL